MSLSAISNSKTKFPFSNLPPSGNSAIGRALNFSTTACVSIGLPDENFLIIKALPSLLKFSDFFKAFCKILPTRTCNFSITLILIIAMVKFIFCIILFLHIKKAPLRACKGANFILLCFISQKYHSCFQTFRLGKS